MVKRIGTVYLFGSNKRFSSRLFVDFRFHHDTPEKGRKTYQPKYCDYNNKDEVNNPIILSNNKPRYITLVQL